MDRSFELTTQTQTKQTKAWTMAREDQPSSQHALPMPSLLPMTAQVLGLVGVVGKDAIALPTRQL